MQATASYPNRDRLDRLKYRATGYELAMEREGTRYLIAYVVGKSRRHLYGALVKRVEHLERITGSNAIDFAARADDGATMSGWRIFWTGRTQREAIIGPELQYIGTVGV